MNKNLNISIVIIGYNTSKSLGRLLRSLNLVKNKNNILEVIYVDDGSDDNSVAVFDSFDLSFNKKFFAFSNNKGRVFARQKGVDLSSGSWLMFLNSNVVVDLEIINNYKKAIDTNPAKVFMGSVIYKSKDVSFEKYLNHHKRGINRFENIQPIHYKYLLFSNCLLSKNVFNRAFFNLKLVHYGGEELDFSYQIHQLSIEILAVKKAVVWRTNAQSLEGYLENLFKYGNKNLKFLVPELQKEVFGGCAFFTIYKIPLAIINVFDFFFRLLARFSFCRQNYFIIRFLFLLNILRGFSSSK